MFQLPYLKCWTGLADALVDGKRETVATGAIGSTSKMPARYFLLLRADEMLPASLLWVSRLWLRIRSAA